MCKPDFNFFSTDMRFKTATGTFLGQCQYVVTNYQSKTNWRAWVCDFVFLAWERH